MPFAAVTADGRVATLTLDAPPEGAGRAFMDVLRAACERLADQIEQVSAVVVCVEGADFVPAWSEDALAEPVGPFMPPIGVGCEALAALPQPTVAALHGRVHSVGLELALACDVRVAAGGATFAMPECGLGGLPRAGGTQRLPRAVGRAQALRLLLTGEEIDAEEAHRIGLVSRVVSPGDEQAAAMEVARAIAAQGPVATRYAKEAVLRGMDLPLQEGLRAELDLTVILQSTADRAEGVRAFIERREPRFTGR